MSARVDRRGQAPRYALHLASLAVGLAAGLAAAWLLSVPPTSAPAAALPPATPIVAGDAPASAPDAAPASLADILRLASPFRHAFALYRLAAGLDTAGVERLLDEAEALDPRRVRRAVSILYARYAELDPAAAVRHAQRQGDDADRWLGVVFRALARSDLDAALAHAEMLDPRQRASVAGAILRVRDDLPQEQRAEIAANLAPQSGMQDRGTRQNHQDDPALAWRQALERRTGIGLFAELSTTLSRWAASDPLAALDAIRSADALEPDLRGALRSSAVWQWATVDPAAALDWTMALPASASRNYLIGDALHGWAANDPRAAAAWLQAQGLPATGYGALEMAKEFAARYPEEAMAWALSLPAAVGRGEAVGAALNAWAELDPRAATAWLDAERMATISREDLLEVAKKYAARHPDAAVEWTAALPPDAAASVAEGVFAALSEADPEGAARLLQRIGDANARHAAERALARGWAKADPVAALAWLDRLYDADRRGALAATLLEEWADYDVASAARHVDRLTDPDTRDGALLAMIGNALDFDADLAEALFARIESADARRRAALRLYKHLSKTDPARAERYR